MIVEAKNISINTANAPLWGLVGDDWRRMPAAVSDALLGSYTWTAPRFDLGVNAGARSGFSVENGIVVYYYTTVAKGERMLPVTEVITTFEKDRRTAVADLRAKQARYIENNPRDPKIFHPFRPALRVLEQVEQHPIWVAL